MTNQRTLNRADSSRAMALQPAKQGGEHDR